MAARAFAPFPQVTDLHDPHDNNDPMANQDQLLGKLEEGFNGIKDALRDIKDDIKDLSQKVAEVEPMQQQIEAQGSAILDIERRLKDQEDATKTAQTVQANNRRWIKVIGSVLTFFIGAPPALRFLSWITSYLSNNPVKPH